MQKLEDCALLEGDILTFLWDDLDVVTIIDLNRVKYLEEKGTLEIEIYNTIYESVKIILENNLDELGKLETFKESMMMEIE